ncbi:MAG: CoA transferase [Chloroflexi bacterium]|nr:CoA transferase [Chloroflexota bacterium]
MSTGSHPSALADLRVLDLSTLVAGPYCTKLLADFGADVIKVEPLSGDPARSLAPFFGDHPSLEGSLLHLYLNTSKRGVTLDLSLPTGRVLLQKLVAWADVLVESFKPGTLDALGLGYKDLSKIKPSIVVVSVTPFGQDGPYKGYRGSEIVEFALGGFMYTYGEYERPPLKHGGHQVQYHTGVNASVATMVAVYHQRATGEGQHVDVSSIETQAATLRDTTSLYAYMGAIRRRSPKEEVTGEGGQGNMVASKDGYFMGGEGGLPRAGLRTVEWDEVVDFLGNEELRSFATEEERRRRRGELRAILQETYAKRAKYDIVEGAQQHHFMFGPVETPADVVHSPQMAARGYFASVNHPTTGPIPFPGRPFIMSETPWGAQRPAPLLGEHNHHVYCDLLGYTPQDLVSLHQLRVI